MTDKIKNYGFDPVETQASITPEDFVFGDGQLEARFEGLTPITNGQWDDFLPPYEEQKFGWGDTYHCTVYGTENAIQALAKAKYGVSEEYSERYLGVLAGIRNGSGGSPHTVIEKWKNSGNLLYKFLPFENIKSWTEFNSPNPMSADLILEGKKWLTKYRIGHDWVYDFTPENLMEALKFSPIGVGVYAWPNPVDGIYNKPSGVRDNHWIIIYGYVKDKYWKAYDHYDGGFKKLAWGYRFEFAKRFTLESLIPNEETMTKVEIEVVKKKGTPDYLVRGKSGMYHRIGDEATFGEIVGDFDPGIEEMDIAKDYIGSPLYLVNNLVKVVLAFLTNLKGRK